MCGILGGNRKNWLYNSSLQNMAHRGPDGTRIWCDEKIVMGFVRLAIMDLSDKGMQPMVSSDENFIVNYNGEIYDFQKLKAELESRGHRFQSQSDTEVILHAYMEWKDRFVDHFDGMFAIVIYDRKEEKIKLFRDRCGIKPLYYYSENGRFAFASELKGLLTLINDRKFEVDKTAVYDFFNYLYIPAPKSIYRNIYKLEQAHKLVFDLVEEKIIVNEAYWTIKLNEKEGDRPASKEHIWVVKELISEAIKNQMIADVPTGAFLSGGIDSSIIVSEALKHKLDYNVFSIGFYDFDTNELPYVVCLEERLNFKAKKYLVKKDEFKGMFSDLRKWFDEPFADTSAYPTYIVSRLARKKCTVVLSGDGGDELFGGYTRYLWLKDFEEKEKPSDEEILEKIWEIHLYQPLPNRKDLKELLGIEKDYDEKWYYKKYFIRDLPPITRMQYMDFHTYLPEDVLTKTDRVSMANSLEVRVPFLDRKIVEFAFSLTQSERCFNGELKKILKDAYIGELPRNLLYRRKWGFGIPQSFFGDEMCPQMKIFKELFYQEIL